MAVTRKIFSLVILVVVLFSGCNKGDAFPSDDNEALDCFCYEYDSKETFYAIEEIYGVSPSGVFIDREITKV